MSGHDHVELGAGQPFPGQKPHRWLWRFHGGPWEGRLADAGGIPERIIADDDTTGVYQRGTTSKLDARDDLTGKGVARGAEYHWHEGGAF